MPFEDRLQDHWAKLDDMAAADFVALLDDIVVTAPPAISAFERACARDSTGRSADAVPLYREALGIGLTGERRRRAVIQLASSLRNIGQVEESVALLTAERAQPSDHLDDAVTATLALALTSTGRDREAVSILITALAPHLPRYQRSMKNYAKLLLES
ncbi:MAG: tetratricopeptide repeat protein [Caulobacteraceae bacterium]